MSNLPCVKVAHATASRRRKKRGQKLALPCRVLRFCTRWPGSPFACAYGAAVICCFVADAPFKYPHSRAATTASRLCSVACFAEFSAYDLWAEVEGRPVDCSVQRDRGARLFRKDVARVSLPAVRLRNCGGCIMAGMALHEQRQFLISRLLDMF